MAFNVTKPPFTRCFTPYFIDDPIQSREKIWLFLYPTQAVMIYIKLVTETFVAVWEAESTRSNIKAKVLTRQKMSYKKSQYCC